MTTITSEYVRPAGRVGCPGKVLAHEALLAVSGDPVMAGEVDAEWVYNLELTFGQNMTALDALCIAVLLRHGYEVGCYRPLSPSERDTAPVLPGGRLRTLCDDTEGNRITAEVTADYVKRLNCGCWEVHVRRPGPVQPHGAGMHLFPYWCGGHGDPNQGAPMPAVIRRGPAG